MSQAWLIGTFLPLFFFICGQKLRKSTISCVTSVRMKQLGSHWMDFHEIWYLRIFWKSVGKIEVLLLSHKNNGYFTWRPIYICNHVLLKFSLQWEMFLTKVVHKIKTHISCSVISPPLPNRAVYEIMWKNIVQPDRPQITIWRMRILCLITKATNAQSEYVTVLAFPRQQLPFRDSSVGGAAVHMTDRLRFGRTDELYETLGLW